MPGHPRPVPGGEGEGFTLPLPPRWKLPLTSRTVWDVCVCVRSSASVSCAACPCVLNVVCCMFCSRWWSREASKRDDKNDSKIAHNFQKVASKWRPGAPRSASCSTLRRPRALEWLLRPTGPNLHQPSSPKRACWRVAGWPLGRPLDTFLKPGGVFFTEKLRQECIFIKFLCVFATNVVFLTFGIDFWSIFDWKNNGKTIHCFNASQQKCHQKNGVKLNIKITKIGNL